LGKGGLRGRGTHTDPQRRAPADGVRQRVPAGHAEYSKGHRKDNLEKREVPPLRERVVAEGVDGA